MSYADAAAKGPKQTAEEKRAPAQPEIIHSEAASTSSLVDVTSESVHLVSSDFSSQPIQTETQKDRIAREAEQFEAKAKAELERAEKEFQRKEKEVKAKAKKAVSRIEANSDNPVVIGNAVAVIALSAGLGFGAYKKYAAGELSWKVVGTWTGLVGLFAAGDYYLSQYLFKNYPPRK